jgi:thymidylate kinase
MLKLNLKIMFRFKTKESETKAGKDDIFHHAGAIVVECVGPPGSGKTTNCKSFSSLLQKKNLNVCLSDDLKAYIRKMTKGRKLFLLAETLVFRGHLLLFYTAALAFNKIYSFDSIYRYFRLSIFNQALQRLIKNKEVDIVILDQWIIQELWSATIFKLPSYAKVKNHLKRFYFKTDFVLYFDVAAEIASERISNRSTRLSRFDLMGPDKRLEELLKYNGYLFELYQNSGCKQKHLFTTDQSPDQNAGKFFRHLKKFTK